MPATCADPDAKAATGLPGPGSLPGREGQVRGRLHPCPRRLALDLAHVAAPRRNGFRVDLRDDLAKLGRRKAMAPDGILPLNKVGIQLPAKGHEAGKTRTTKDEPRA